MTPKQLEDQQIKINELVEKTAYCAGLANDCLLPIYDGIADEQAYLKSKPKVAWVLKEPYDDISQNTNKPEGGGWSLPKDCFKKDDAWKNPVWQKIAYIMYAFRKHMRWEDMKNISDEPQMINVIYEVAYINISKMPNKKTSDSRYIEQQYANVWQSVIKKQLAVYDPDIIIFGNTFNCFLNDPKGNIFKDASKDEKLSKKLTEKGGWSVDYLRCGRKRLISAYHPARKGPDYCIALIDALNLAEKELKAYLTPGP